MKVTSSSIHTMLRSLSQSKIQRFPAAHCRVNCECSCASDEDRLDASGSCENEQVQIWNVNNGERFNTYAIRAAGGSRIISVNGLAARRASIGNLVDIAAFAQLDVTAVKDHLPQLVFETADHLIAAQRQTMLVQQL